MKYHICVVIIHIDSGLMWWLQVGITKPNPYYSIAHGIKFQCNSQSEEKKKEKKTLTHIPCIVTTFRVIIHIIKQTTEVNEDGPRGFLGN